MSLEIPLVNLPTENGSYKIVQFYINNNPYLRFGEKGTDFHKYIIIRLCNEFNKDVEFMKDDIPKLKTLWYKVCGMGISNLNIEHKIITTKDIESFDYHLGLNLNHLDLIKKQHPEWNFIIK